MRALRRGRGGECKYDVDVNRLRLDWAAFEPATDSASCYSCKFLSVVDNFHSLGFVLS